MTTGRAGWPVRVSVAVVGAVAALGVLVAGSGTAAAVDASAPARHDAPARRVLVFSLPYVSWADLEGVSLPTIDGFVARAAVAGLSTRVDARATPLADGYATLGAGTRAVGVPRTAGDGLMAGEAFGAVTAGEAYEQRTGRAPSGAVVFPGIVLLTDANRRLRYDAEIGALADATAAAGVGRAVIANGDGREPDAATSASDATPGPARQRQAVLGLLDRHGEVAHGRVDPGLLERRARDPFGVRLAHRAVLEAFDDAWRGRTVVLVEASDLIRVERYRPYASRSTSDRQRRTALERADRLLAGLLERVDPRRDLVMIVGPAHAPGSVTLTPLAIRGPGFPPGWLRSPSTRRSGFVQIQDLAPTILAALGIERPPSMEGRAARTGAPGGSPDQRIDFLVRADAAARFRDARIGEVYGLLVGAVLVNAALGAVALWWCPTRRWRRAATLAGLWAIGLLAAAFLVRLVPLHEAGPVVFHVALVAVGGLVALAGSAVARRRTLDGLLAVLGFVVVVLTLDALRGAPLVLNSVLGYSPTVAGRFAGFGNPAFAAYSAAALFAAVLVAHRVAGRAGLAAAGVILAGAIVVDIAPMWGADVGGMLSMVPAYGLTMVLLSGRRVRARTIAAVAVAVGVVVAAVALLDAARPEQDRTHLGRLVERVRDNGAGEGWTVIARKLDQNLASVGSSILGLVLLVAVVGAVVVWRRDPARVRHVLAAVPEWRAGSLGFVVLAALGFACNDSGMTVPGIMLVVFVAAWVYLLVSVPAPAERGGEGSTTARRDRHRSAG